MVGRPLMIASVGDSTRSIFTAKGLAPYWATASSSKPRSA
jgi:hypothetical protein